MMRHLPRSPASAAAAVRARVVAVGCAVLVFASVLFLLAGMGRGPSSSQTSTPADAVIATLRAEKLALRREVGRLSCALNGVGPNGGFCLSETGVGGPAVGGNILPPLLSTALFELFGGSSVIDLGAGVGHYERHWESLAEEGKNGFGPTSVRAFDGAENVEAATKGKVQWADLTDRADFGAADWVLSLEVAEHIPADKEAAFLDNLQRHAGKGMVISWAVPGQGGHHHVNNQDESYVVPTVEKFGFMIDRGVTARLREVMLESTVAAWFRETLPL
jgi:SAM-dependent methyltransferase